MSFFCKSIIDYNKNILLDFFNGTYINEMLSGDFISYYRKKDHGSIFNKKVNLHILHTFTNPFPTKYLTDKEYINFRYKYFTDNKYKFFYTIDLITYSFSKLTSTDLEQFEKYLIENNFNLQNFVYIDIEKNISKFKNTKIPYILLQNRSNYNKLAPTVEKCPGTICTICKKNSKELNYILNQIERIKCNN